LERFLTQFADPEIYVATWHPDREESTVSDRHVDHAALALAVRDLAAAYGVVARYARHYGQRKGYSGAAYQARTEQQWNRIEGAVAAYKVIGQRSARPSFQSVLDTRGSVKVTG
jgi:hypothetical protein